MTLFATGALQSSIFEALPLWPSVVQSLVAPSAD